MPGSDAFEANPVTVRLIRAIDPEASIPSQISHLKQGALAELARHPRDHHHCLVILAGQIAREMLLAHKMSEKLATRRAVDLMLALQGSA